MVNRYLQERGIRVMDSLTEESRWAFSFHPLQKQEIDLLNLNALDYKVSFNP